MKILYPALIALLACASASATNNPNIQSAKNPVAVKVGTTKPMPEHTDISQGFKSLPIQASMKHRDDVTNIRKAVTKSALRNARSSSAVFFESFETGAYDAQYLPEGWTTTSTKAIVEDPGEHWYLYPGVWSSMYYGFAPADGDYMMCILYSKDYKEDMLISPMIEVGENMELNYYWFTNPFYFYDVYNPDNYDWENHEFINRVKMFNLEVLVREEGSKYWRKIDDLESHYSQMSAEELLDATPYEMKRETVSLNKYVGKNVQIAFRYIGRDGDSVMLDCVYIDYPELNAWFDAPIFRQFIGLTLDQNWSYNTTPIEIYPVNEPITFSNLSENGTGTAYTWSYTDPTAIPDDNAEVLTCTEPDGIEITYMPTYFDNGTPCLLHDYPVLTASAPFCSDTQFTRRSVIQAGGDYESEFNDGTPFRAGFLPFSPATDGICYYTDIPKEGQMVGTPIFGYSPDCDEYWADYVYIDELAEGEYAHNVAFMNWVWLPESPMVVNGAVVAARGEFDEARASEIELKLGVRTLDQEGVPSEHFIAEAICKGEDILREPMAGFDYLTINFKFDSPLVLSALEHPAGVLFEVSGFHNDAFEYFAPMQSGKPNEFEYDFGFVRNHRVRHGEEYDAYMRLSNHIIEGREMYCSFAISLDAAYPWLLTEAEPVEVGKDFISINFDSFYAAEDLTIDAPEWIDAAITGRYRDTKLTLAVNEKAEIGKSGVVTISAPGVSTRINVTSTASGIANVNYEPNNRADVFDLTGALIMRNATAEDVQALPAGFYIHGTRKAIVK